MNYSECEICGIVNEEITYFQTESRKYVICKPCYEYNKEIAENWTKKIWT